MISVGSALKTGVIAAENSAFHHKNKLHFKYIKTENSYFNLQ